jgi:hypothetical protein
MAELPVEGLARARPIPSAGALLAAAVVALVGFSTRQAKAEEAATPLRLHLRASAGAFYGHTDTRSQVVVDGPGRTVVARFPAVYSGIGAGAELGVGLASQRVAFGLLWSGQLTPRDRLGSAASVAGFRASSSELLERSTLGAFLEARFNPWLVGGSLGWTSLPSRLCCNSDPAAEVSQLDAGYDGLSAGLWLGFERALSESYSYRLALRSGFLFNDLLQITADRDTTSMVVGLMFGFTRN